MTEHFFLYDTESLASLASEETIKQGLDYFTANRVFDLDCSEHTLSALVEGSVSDEPHSVNLTRSNDDQLTLECSCDNPKEFTCKHCIATLYAYADKYYAENTQLNGAIEEAILERVKKGRNEVQIKQLSGSLHFGTWQASSIISATYRKQVYQVQIRSVEQRNNYCTCPDLASNRLGTCKHIEAVIHFIEKQPTYKNESQSSPSISYSYLSWDSATHPQIKLHRSTQVDDQLAQIFNDYFDDNHVFKGQLPEDFFQFRDRLYGFDDFQQGEDAIRFVRQLSEDSVHKLRAQEITRQIKSSDGLLPGIRARLFPYQIEGVAFLASTGKALLADDMGLGKTLQAIAASTWLADHSGVERILITCPASLKHQWHREIEKFTGHQAQIIQGGPETRQVQYRAEKLFFIINYELILRDLSIISRILKPDLLILDEAQRIKNWKTKIASTIKLISTRYAFVLTGTPLENRIEDLYSLLQVVDARVLGPLWRCMLDFHITDERGKILGYRNLSELRQRLAPVMLRRDRSLVKDQLPSRTEVRLDIAMTDAQLELHDHALSSAGRLAHTARKRPLTPSEQNRLMAALQQARMACNAAGLVDKETAGSPKLDELNRLLEELCLQSNRKVVIFSQWERMTAMIEKNVKKLGLGSVRLHGGVPVHKRGELMDQFSDNDAIQVFISTDAGGVGLNLQAATLLINMDMPWNPAVLDQRIARIHRLGQKENVQIFLLLAENSYEQQVAKLVQGKRNLFDNVINPEGTEDVVGVSKKMLETIIDDLGTEHISTPGEKTTALEQGVLTEPTRDSDAITITDDGEADKQLHQFIEQLQNRFSSRIVQIQGTNGGLLVVLNQLNPQDEEFVQTLSNIVPVTLISTTTLTGLQHLGMVANLVDTPNTTILYENKAETSPANPLLKLAQEKLRAAETLLEGNCNAGVMELLGSALLATVATLAKITQIPSIETATIWMYSEALPKELLTSDQAATIIRICSLSHATDIPKILINQSMEDTKLFIGTCFDERQD